MPLVLKGRGPELLSFRNHVLLSVHINILLCETNLASEAFVKDREYMHTYILCIHKVSQTFKFCRILCLKNLIHFGVLNRSEDSQCGVVDRVMD